MTGHEHIHRRHARAAFPDPFAIASAAGFAIPNPFAAPDPNPTPVANAIPKPSPEANPQPRAGADPEQTHVSVVYVTASKTFDGPVGGYTTLGYTPPAVKADPTTPPSKTPTKATPTESAKKSSKIVADTTFRKSTGLPSQLVASATSVDTDIPLLAATGGLSTSLAATKSSTGTLSASTSTSEESKAAGGMSAGGKAGLAIGILLLLGAVLALVLFFVKKRRASAKQERLDDEKTEVWGGAAPARSASTRTNPNAPQLSLRPITQFTPNLGEKQQNQGSALALTPSSANAQPRSSQWERPMGGQDAVQSNPFGNHAEVIDTTNANGPPVVNEVSPEGEIVAAGVAGAAVGAGIGLARGASKRSPNQLDFTKSGPFKGPPSPAGTEFSMSSEGPGTPMQSTGAAAIAAAGGPPNSAVHRVQLDFKPSMDDELELRAGQLIRLLHEYDDGWALCIRLDRTRQGVVPRTCLSTRPVKPRPQQNGPRGPPPPGMRVPNQGPRPMSPSMNQGPRPMSPGMKQGPRPMSPAMNQGPPRSMSPAGNRPMTPNGRPMTPQGRPMTPTGAPQSTPNSQQSRPRSPSVAQMKDRRNSPPGPSPMNPNPNPIVSGSPPNPAGPLARKPVGQAM